MIEPSKLASLPFFQGISPEDMTKLLEELDAREVFYEKGSFLVHAGDKITAAGLVLSGEVHILREDFWGCRALVAQIPPGAFFGETYALLDTAAEVSVLAAADTTVLYLSLNRILAPTGQTNPLFALLSRRLLQIFAGRNLTLTRKIAHVTCRSTREKLLSFLSSCAQDSGSAVFSIPFDRQQLADYLAVERSAMSAELSRMKKDGLLDYHKNHFRLFTK
ncbi:Crp/Fnr family transcriptional regulator [Anaerotignum lactatifermentans]|uniref:Crp/Fnr family transcriptional regulator n=1 Tax=Anaerotignum lactatifermentans TaxID=160404 RepID=UPI00307B232C